jgi:hypothetical protein
LGFAGECEYKGASVGRLPNEVKNWAGIEADLGEFEGGSLAELNDDGKKFSTIAKIIESKPDGLFV